MIENTGKGNPLVFFSCPHGDFLKNHVLGRKGGERPYLRQE